MSTVEEFLEPHTWRRAASKLRDLKTDEANAAAERALSLVAQAEALPDDGNVKFRLKLAIDDHRKVVRKLVGTL